MKPQLNIIENGPVTNFSPHTITLDTDNRKKLVIIKIDLAIVTQPLPSPQKQTSPPKRLTHMVACKSLRECNINQAKIKQFCFEEKRRAKQKQQSLMKGPSSSKTPTPSGEQDLYSLEKLVTNAKNNQRQQQQNMRTQQKRNVNIEKQQPRQQLSPQRRKKDTMPQKGDKIKIRWKTETKPKPNESFLSKSRAAALKHTKLHIEKQSQQSRSFIRIDEKELKKSPTPEVITLTFGYTQSSPLKVYTSNKKFDVMATSSKSPEIPTTFTSRISTPKISKVVKKIQQLNETQMPIKSPIEIKITPLGTTSIQDTSLKNIPADNTSNENGSVLNRQTTSKQPPTSESQPILPQEHERNEQHYIPTASPGKSSMFDIKTKRLLQRRISILKFLSLAGGNAVCTSRRNIETVTKHLTSITYKHS